MSTTNETNEHAAIMRDAHDLLPPGLAATIPPLYATEGQGDTVIAHVKLFTPDSSWTWYVTEYDPAERLCFGLVIGLETEMGYFSLDDLQDARGPLGLTIERDLWWQATPLGAVRSGEAR